MPIAPLFPAGSQTHLDKPRLLILIVAYNAEQHVESVLKRVPHVLAEEYDVEVLVLDDSSQDATFEKTHDVRREGATPFVLHVVFNPVNQGYGGNQKLGYHFAIERGFDFVALLHGDGQYAPESLPDLVRPLRVGAADAVLGSRMLTPSAALKGGMPLYKFVGNRVLTWFQNRVLGTSLSEFHSGYRVYSVAALKKIPFALNTNGFPFDTEIIIQLLIAGMRIEERPIPTYYGDEICRVNGLKYAAQVATSVVVAWFQKMALFYDRRFDCAPVVVGDVPYTAKLDFDSPHTAAVDAVPEGARVLDLGCAGGYVGAMLRRRRHCRVTGVDRRLLSPGVELDDFILHDLNDGLPPVDFGAYDYVLLLDVLEHLASPETLTEELRLALKFSPSTKLIVSTANIGFFVTRFMLLGGSFNYGKRGILDLTHTRLFTFGSFRRLFEQSGFHVVSMRGIPAPWPLVLGRGIVGRAALAINRRLIWLARGLFSYQMFGTVEPMPSLEHLLRQSLEHSADRSRAWNERMPSSTHRAAVSLEAGTPTYRLAT